MKETYQFTVETTTSQGKSHTLNITMTIPNPTKTCMEAAVLGLGYDFTVKDFKKKTA